MRRRIVPMLIALLAVALATWRRSRRRATALIGPVEAPAATPAGAQALLITPPRLLDVGTSSSPEDHPVIADQAGDSDNVPNGRVEGEARGYDTTPRFVSVAWAPNPDPPPSDAAEVTIGFALVSGQMRLDRVDVRETASQVFVTVLAWWEPAAGAAGTDACVETISLERPLGDRALVHAPLDHPPT